MYCKNCENKLSDESKICNACGNVKEANINNDLGLDYFSLDSYNNIKKYADDIYGYVVFVGVGKDGEFSSIEKASDYELGRLMNDHLMKYVDGTYVCYEKEYFNNKLYEYYNRKVDGQSYVADEILTNYYCFFPGGGDSTAKLIDNYSTIDNDEYNFYYKTEWDNSDWGYFNDYSMIIIKFKKQGDKIILVSIIYEELNN